MNDEMCNKDEDESENESGDESEDESDNKSGDESEDENDNKSGDDSDTDDDPHNVFDITINNLLIFKNNIDDALSKIDS